MAKITDIAGEKDQNMFVSNFYRLVQSSHLNFLIGSGCSLPAIKVLGDIEGEVTQLKNDGYEDDAVEALYDFMLPILDSTNRVISGDAMNP